MRDTNALQMFRAELAPHGRWRSLGEAPSRGKAPRELELTPAVCSPNCHPDRLLVALWLRVPRLVPQAAGGALPSSLPFLVGKRLTPQEGKCSISEGASAAGPRIHSPSGELNSLSHFCTL